MNKTELIAEVRKKSAIDGDVEKIVDILDAAGLIDQPYTKATVRQVIQVMPLMQEKPEQAILSLTPKATDIVTVEIQAGQIEPAVRRVRARFFSKEEPPFTAEQIKEKWPDSFPFSDSFDPFGPIDADMVGLTRQETEWRATVILDPIQCPGVALTIPKKPGFPPATTGAENVLLKVKKILTQSTSRQSRRGRELSEEVKKLARPVGWRDSEMMDYVLTGHIPELAPVLISPQFPGAYSLGSDGFYGSGVGQQEPSPVAVTVTFKSRDLTFNELLSVYRLIREALGLTKKKRLTDIDLQVYRLLKANPDVFNDGKVAGYQTLQKAWNAAHKPKDRFKDKAGYEGIRKALDRLDKKLGGSLLRERQKKEGKG